jgi:hypothetical protein
MSVTGVNLFRVALYALGLPPGKWTESGRNSGIRLGP